MSYELEMEKRGDVLQVKALGERKIETVMEIAKEIMGACAERGTLKVLVDVKGLEGRLATIEAYKVVSSFFATIRDRSAVQKCAIVDLKEFEERYKFFEDVAVNRGYNLHVFSEVEEGMKWLEGDAVQ